MFISNLNIYKTRMPINLLQISPQCGSTETFNVDWRNSCSLEPLAKERSVRVILYLKKLRRIDRLKAFITYSRVYKDARISWESQENVTLFNRMRRIQTDATFFFCIYQRKGRKCTAGIQFLEVSM